MYLIIEILYNKVLNNIHSFSSFLTSLEEILKHLDPSLFQNVILGILAIFIPILVVFLDDKDQDYLQIESIKNELLKVKSVFWLSIITIFIFAIYKHLDLNFRFLSLIIVLILVFFLIKIFFEILRFSRKEIFKYEKNYLKNLDINTAKDDLQNSCQALWSRSEIFYSNENEFTDIFIKHIDEAVESRKFDLAINLVQIYIDNLNDRTTYSTYTMYAKILEWHKILWQEEYIVRVEKTKNEKYKYFWNWMYFVKEAFPSMVKKLLKDKDEYQVFTILKEHIAAHKLILESHTTNEEEKERYWKYIETLLGYFCTTLFDNIDNIPSSYDIWEYNFPSEWKISIINKDNRISRIILSEFLKWADDKIFKSKKGEYDSRLTKVINGIFPNIDSSLFTSFFMISYSNNSIKYALEKVLNFYILGTSAEGTFSNGESKEDIDRIISNKLIQKESDQKKETIQIIIEYFHFWSILKYYKNDLSEDENQGWVNFTKEERQAIITKVRKQKLGKLKEDIESEEITKICEESEIKIYDRDNFLKLIDLLIKEIKKPE